MGCMHWCVYSDVYAVMCVSLDMYVHGVVNFEFDSSGPSAIEVWLPHVSASGIGYPWQPSNAVTGYVLDVLLCDAYTMCTHIDHNN